MGTFTRISGIYLIVIPKKKVTDLCTSQMYLFGCMCTKDSCVLWQDVSISRICKSNAHRKFRLPNHFFTLFLDEIIKISTQDS